MSEGVYGSSEGQVPKGSFYQALEEDPIRAITDTLVANLVQHQYGLAQQDFRRLVATLINRGSQGKDIRYAQRELGELARDAKKDAGELARIASRYIAQLPEVRVERRRSRQGLEARLPQ